MNSDGWDSELELVEVLQLILERRSSPPAQGRLRIFREFDAGLGRVDLLAVWYDAEIIRTRALSVESYESLPLFDSMCGYAMSFLRERREATREALQLHLRTTKYRVGLVVDALARRSLISTQESRLCLRPIRALWSIRAIEAYEAKLTDWTRASEQAIRHLWFASRAYVVMPRLGPKALARVVNQCDFWKIGLLLFSGRDSLSMGCRPRSRQTPYTQLGWNINELFFEEACRAAI